MSLEVELRQARVSEAKSREAKLSAEFDGLRQAYMLLEQERAHAQQERIERERELAELAGKHSQTPRAEFVRHLETPC